MQFARKLKDESGQAMIVTLLSMTVLLGLVGFAADIGTLLRAKRNVQIAADSAAISAAAELNYGDMATAATDSAAQNGIIVGTNGGAVAVQTPPSYGAYAGQAGYVEAIVSQDQPTFFMNMFNISSQTVTARAVASSGASHECVVTLKASGTDILMNGSVNLTALSCSIIDNSNDNNSALLANGPVTLHAQSIGVVGQVLNNGGNITPTPIMGIAQSSDPLAFLTPPANPGGCSSVVLNSGIANSYGNGTTFTLPHGCYSGLTINGSPTVTLSPGIYYMTGSTIINGSPTVTGSGVTLYLSGNAASLIDNGTPTLNLSAPTSGAYNGILFYQNPSDGNTLTINGSSSSNLQGIFYAPGANVIMNGSGSATFYTAFVVGSLTFNGSGTLLDYASINGGSPLISVRLVE